MDHISDSHYIIQLWACKFQTTCISNIFPTIKTIGSVRWLYNAYKDRLSTYLYLFVNAYSLHVWHHQSMCVSPAWGCLIGTGWMAITCVSAWTGGTGWLLLAMPKGSYENDDQNIVVTVHTYLFTLSISPMFKDIQRHPSVLVKFDFNQVGFVFLFVFGHEKVGHDMRMFNYQWDNHGKRTSNNPINPVHRILNTPWKPWFRIDSIGSII